MTGQRQKAKNGFQSTGPRPTIGCVCVCVLALHQSSGEIQQQPVYKGTAQEDERKRDVPISGGPGSTSAIFSADQTRTRACACTKLARARVSNTDRR